MNDSELRRLMFSEEGLPADRRERIRNHVMATIGSEETAQRHRPVKLHRRWRGLVPAMASALVLVIAGTAAAALGIFPWQTRSILEQAGCRDAGSVERMVATAPTNDGRTFEFWITTATDDSSPNGHILVELDRDGGYLGSSLGCGAPEVWNFADDLGDTWVVSPLEGSNIETLMTLMGHVPTQATSAEVTLSDATVTRIEVQTDGYFLGFVYGPGVKIGPGVPPPPFAYPVHIAAFDANGSIVAEKDLD